MHTSSDKMPLKIPSYIQIRLDSNPTARGEISTVLISERSDFYKIQSLAEGDGQHARYKRALQLVGRSFGDDAVLRHQPPSEDLDDTWSVRFRFARTPLEAEWDLEVSNTRNALFDILSAHENGTLSDADEGLVHRMSAAAWCLNEASRISGDPTLWVARNMLMNLYGQTPSGREHGSLGRPDTRTSSPEGIKSATHKAAAVLREMLDVGASPDCVGASMPKAQDYSDFHAFDAARRDYRSLWNSRAVCLTALALKETGEISTAWNAITREMIDTKRHLISLSGVSQGSEQSQALQSGVWALSCMLAETPWGQARAAQSGRAFDHIDADQAEGALLGAASEILETIHDRFPSPGHECNQHSGLRPNL